MSESKMVFGPYPAMGPYGCYYSENLDFSNNGIELALEIVATSTGIEDVPISLTRGSFLFFEFDKSHSYCGGDIPECKTSILSQTIIRKIKERDKLQYMRIKYMNAFLLCFKSALDNSLNMNSGLPTLVRNHNFIPAYKEHQMIRIDLQRTKKIEFTPNLIKASSQILNDAIQCMNKLKNELHNASYPICDLLRTAQEHFSNHEFDSALLLSWSCSEKILNLMLNNKLDFLNTNNGGITHIDSKRKKEILGSDNFMCTEILSLTGVINDDLRTKIIKCRAKRNNLAHSIVTVDSDDSTLSIQLAHELLSLLVGQIFRPSLSNSSIYA